MPANDTPMNDEQAREMALVAVRTLRRSERGRQALHDFSILLANGGDGLDDENWRALIRICQLGACGKVAVLDNQFYSRPSDTR